jgi:glycerol-3-phosphate dehydrogenase
MGLLDKPSERGAIIIKIGLLLYDAYTGGERVVPRHQFFSQDRSQELFPQINPKVVYSAKYYDGLLLAPERLCIDMVLDVERENLKSHALNYVPVIGSTENLVKLQDQVSGEIIEIKPKIVINASGPWIDFTNEKLGFDSKYISGTKGSHLIVDNPNLRSAIGENEFFFENADGRIVLLFPYEDKVLVGTSDLPIQDPDSARCTDEEIDYFINMVKIVFPEISIQHDQIVFQFSGVRPLPASDSSNAGQISRDHKIQIIPSGDRCNFPVFNLIGGKWTSFRAFSEEVTDNVIDELGLSRKSNTSDIAIGGGRGYPRNTNDSVRWVEQLASATGTSETRTQLLFSRYGTRAEEFFNSDPTKSEIQLSTLPQYSKEEILHIVRSEKVIHVDDLILRRSNIAKSGLLNRTVIVELAGIIGSALSWSDQQLESEIQRTIKFLKEFHGVML